MPELPEVETIRRDLEGRVVGRRIVTRDDSARHWQARAGDQGHGRGDVSRGRGGRAHRCRRAARQVPRVSPRYRRDAGRAPAHDRGAAAPPRPTRRRTVTCAPCSRWTTARSCASPTCASSAASGWRTTWRRSRPASARSRWTPASRPRSSPTPSRTARRRSSRSSSTSGASPASATSTPTRPASRRTSTRGASATR